MTQTFTTSQITAIGGREWTGRNGEHRIYLNDWATLAGLDIERYGSGNIRSASLTGHTISNNTAGRILGARVYLDVPTGTIRTNLRRVVDDARLSDDIADTLIRNLLASIRRSTTREMTTRQAAAELGVSIRTVQRRAAAGKLTAHKGGRRWIITL